MSPKFGAHVTRLGNARHLTNSWIAIISDNILFAYFAKRRVIQKNNVEKL